MKTVVGLILIVLGLICAYRLGHFEGELDALKWANDEIDKIFNKDEKRNDNEDKSM